MPTNYVNAIRVDGTSENVTLKVLDVLGCEVATLVNEVRTAGEYTVTFDASNLSGGTYVYRLQVGNYRAAKKLILLR